MKKTLRKVLSLTLVLLLCLPTLLACGGNGKEKDTTAPVITVENVPTGGIMGREVTLPAGTATDDVDGDLTSSLKLTVEALKDDGSLGVEILFKVSANKINTFKTNNRYKTYNIVYFVSDKAGNLAEKKTLFTATEDDIAPVIEITEPNFDVAAGITGSNMRGYILPTAKGSDNPGNLDITADIQVNIKKDTKFAASYTYTKNPQYLIPGNYTVTYALQDGANNLADEISFPLTINSETLTGVNLLHGSSMVIGHDARFNEFGELEIGKTANGNGGNDMSSATFKYDLFDEEILAITLNIDPTSVSGGESNYNINYIYSNGSQKFTPTGLEGQWAPYMVFRMEETRNLVMGKGGSGVQAGGNPAYNTTLRDGKDHTLYFKFEREGASSTDANAKIWQKVWVDKTPAEEPTISAYIFRSNADTPGAIDEETFDDMWNTPEGYLNFGSFSSTKGSDGKWGDDVMRIKGLAVYDKDETAFNTDIVAPVITVEACESRYFVNTIITFNTATAADQVDGQTAVEAYVVDPNNKKIALETDMKFTPAEIGTYTVVYTSKDKSNNLQYKKFHFRVTQNDSTPPEITLSSNAAINASVGEAFDLPTATAQDNLDGVITDKIGLRIEGADSNSNIFVNGVLTSFTIEAVGQHKLVYFVSDDAGNIAEETVIVQVTNGKTGNIITSFSGGSEGSVSLNGTNTTFREQKIYNEKVSMIVNVKNNNGQWMGQLRGNLSSNLDWPGGIMMSLAGDQIRIYANGVNVYGLGAFDNPFADRKNLMSDVLFEYQLTEMTVGGIKYLRIRYWFCAKEVNVATSYNGGNTPDDPIDYSFSADELRALGHEIEGGGLFVNLEEETFVEKYAQNLNASYIHFSAQGGRNLDIKEARIDGSSMQTPWEEPTQEVGMELPEFGTESAKPAFEGESAQARPGDAGVTKFSTAQKAASESAQNVTLEGVSLGVRFELKAGQTSMDRKDSYLKLLGSAPTSYWGFRTGIALRFYNGASGQPEISINVNDVQAAWIYEDETKDIYQKWINNQQFYINYVITYVLDANGFVTNVKIKLMYSDDNVTWKNVDIYYNDQGAELGEITNTIGNNACSNELIIPVGLFGDVADYTPNGVFGIIQGNPATGQDDENAANFYMNCNYVKAESR